MSDHDEALRLAESLRRCSAVDFDGDFAKAAVMLERIAALEADRDSWERQASDRVKDCADMAERIAALEAVLIQARHAIDLAGYGTSMSPEVSAAIRAIEAALRQKEQP